jgi:hypothetical protein
MKEAAIYKRRKNKKTIQKYRTHKIENKSRKQTYKQTCKQTYRQTNNIAYTVNRIPLKLANNFTSSANISLSVIILPSKFFTHIYPFLN